MKMFVVAPHPDDEVLGVGGTIHRLCGEGHDVTVAIATKGWSPLFDESQVRQVRAEARAANDRLGTGQLRFLDLPVTRLHALPEHELNGAFDALFSEEEPDWVFLPFPGDLHEDHRQIFDACQVALRPSPDRRPIERIVCYETVSETHWAAPGVDPTFSPQWFVDVSDHLDAKLDAMALYTSQVRPAPDARSVEAVSSLAKWRGSVVGVAAAEAFVVIREHLSATSRADRA